MASTVQGSTLYGGSVSSAIIYKIAQGLGFQWGKHLYTEVLVDGKPRQLTRAEHDGDPIRENVKQPRFANFGAAPGTTIDGRQLTVANLMVGPEDIDVTEWKQTFPQFQPSGTNIDLKVNPEIQSVVFDLMQEAAKTQMNKLVSVGDNSLIAPNPLRFIDGFVKLILADVDATQVGVNTVITEANVITRFLDLRDAVEERLALDADLTLFCSFADVRLFDRARRTTQNNMPTTDIVGEYSLQNANGTTLNIVPILGLPKNFAFITVASNTPKSNLVQGVWVANEEEAMKVYREVEVDQIWLMLMRFDYGVQYKSGKDIVYIKSA